MRATGRWMRWHGDMRTRGSVYCDRDVADPVPIVAGKRFSSIYTRARRSSTGRRSTACPSSSP